MVVSYFCNLQHLSTMDYDANADPLHEKAHLRMLKRPKRPTLLLEMMRSSDTQERINAEEGLWEQFVPNIRQLARKRMPVGGLPIADDEDVAISVFRVFFDGIKNGRFAATQSKGQAQALLNRLTVDKTIDLIRFHQAKRRCPRMSRPLEIEENGNRRETLAYVQSIPDDIADSRQRTASNEIEWREEANRMINALSESTLKTIVVMRFLGYSNDEIASKLGCVTRTVERKLNVIRRIWGTIADSPIGEPGSTGNSEPQQDPSS